MDIVTPQNRLDFLADNVVARTKEVFHYQVNIDNYGMMLLALPIDEWPAHLAQYKTTKVEALPAEMSMDDVVLVSEYQQRDRLNQLLRTEKIEQSKSQRVLDALVAQIPVDQYDVLVGAAMLRANPA